MYQAKFKLILLLIISINIPLISQMPDWKFFKDRDGNKYFLDRNGKIWTSGKPEFKFKPVSILGIDYYVNQGRELIRRHHPVEGLILLKSILAMPVDNNRVYSAKIKAAKIIDYLKKREGGRFKRMNESASIQLFRKNKKVYLINDLMFYSLQLPQKVVILKNKIIRRLKYRHYGLLLGIGLNRKDKKGVKNKYDFLLAIDSEQFNRNLKSIEEVERNWRMILGADNLKRSRIEKNRFKIVYKFQSNNKHKFSGYEGIFINRNYAHIIRIISSKRKFLQNKVKMKKIITNISLVSSLGYK